MGEAGLGTWTELSWLLVMSFRSCPESCSFLLCHSASGVSSKDAQGFMSPKGKVLSFRVLGSLHEREAGNVPGYVGDPSLFPLKGISQGMVPMGSTPQAPLSPRVCRCQCSNPEHLRRK